MRSRLEVQMNTALVFSILAFSVMQALRGGEPTLADVVSAHESALGLIHSIELTLSHESQYFAGGKQALEPHSWSWHWVQCGSTERIRYRTQPSSRDNGLPEGIYDFLADRNEVRMLRNWDPSDPQEITPLDQGSVSAVIRPRDRTPPFVADTERFLLWQFNFGANDESRSLSDLVRESGTAELVGKAEINGHATWHIRVVDPKAGGKFLSRWGFDIFVDPAVNFNVRRVIEHHQDVRQLINGIEETFPIDLTRTVLSFRGAGDGVFVPTAMEYRLVASTSDGREEVTSTSVSNLKINEPLSPGALDFQFPEHALVIYSPPQTPTQQRVVLWGAANMPSKEIKGAVDLPGFEEAQKKAQQQPGMNGTVQPFRREGSWLLIANILGIVVLCVIYITRKLRAKQQ